MSERRGREVPTCRIPRRIGVEALEGRRLLTTFTVTNTSDSGNGSLRQAITNSNGSSISLPNTIQFSIGSGVQTISPTSALPSITEPTIVDGTTQPGFVGTPLIELDGSGAGVGAVGFGLVAGGSSVKALSIVDWTASGITIQSSDNLVIGCDIGLDTNGTTSGPNGSGVIIQGGSDNTVGGTTAAARDVISANSNYGVEIAGNGTLGNVVEGDYLGLAVDGVTAKPDLYGVYVLNSATANTIGGTIPASQDVISGNTDFGVVLEGVSLNVVEGDEIGTAADGTTPVANSLAGVLITLAADGNTIGGTAVGSTDVISGNAEVGVDITMAGTSSNLVEGDDIGTAQDGVTPVANGTGVYIEGSATGDTIGGTIAAARDVILGNTNFGVDIAMNGTMGNVVEGDYIGLASDGTTAVGNGPAGDGVDLTTGATGNTIGGTIPGSGDVISGNADGGIVISGTSTVDNVVEGDDIGTAAGGMTGIGNGTADDVLIETGADGNTIGGTSTIGSPTAGARNLIDSATLAGVEINGSGTLGNVVEGNYIGLAADGMTPLGDSIGVLIDGGASSDVIGGPTALGSMTPGLGNVISSNGMDGIEVDGGSNGIVEGNIVGLAADGTTPRANADGVLLDGSVVGITIGGTAAGDGDLISGNTNGVVIDGADGNLVEGDTIGLATDGNTPEGNSVGVTLENFSTGNTIGGTTVAARDVISGNTAGMGIGVYVINVAAPGDAIEGDDIGTNAAGTAAAGNLTGILLGASLEPADDVTIGGTFAGSGDVISGNTGVGVDLADGGYNLLAGNLIGLATDGTTKVPNAGGIVDFGGSDTIGGTTAAARDVISGNTGDGVSVQAEDFLVEGDYIGTDVSGTVADGNTGSGVSINPPAVDGGNTIGGAAAGDGNVISGNGSDGVDIVNSRFNLVAGNIIGLAMGGMASLGNGGSGVLGGPGNAGINTIGGTGAARDVISGNVGFGIDDPNSDQLIEGNDIGVAADGATARPNSGGLFLGLSASNDTIGGTVAGTGNVISGNTGIGLDFEDATNDLVVGNIIGLASTGFTAVGNGTGVQIGSQATLITIGGTTIAASTSSRGTPTAASC